MLERLRTGRGTSVPDRVAQLPQRRWTIRAPRVYLWGLVGAVIFSIAPFVMWWLGNWPLWILELTAILGWLTGLPSPLALALDHRGIALIQKGWIGQKYLWIPHDRLVRMEIKQGWLLATGTNVEQQGDLDWSAAARQAGASSPEWLNLFVQSPGLAPFQLAAPVHLLDRLARDEIELWLYRQGK